MSYHQETIEISGPFNKPDPLSRLVEFYDENGYRLTNGRPAGDTEGGEGSGQKDRDHVELERGKPGAGWWTSNMTELHARVVAERIAEETILVEYRVDVTGQLLNDDERTFWQREARHAGHYVRGEASEVRDMRISEGHRARKQRKRLLSYGLWGAVAVFIVGASLILLGII
ncbi:MAG: hypothetical protein ACOCV2_09460 [Persicimonas sp.]